MGGETTLTSIGENSESTLSEKEQTPVSSASTHTVPFLNPLWSGIATREGLFIGLVFILAFIVRAYLMRFELFFEFDSYWHARMVSYIIQGLPAPLVDPLAYYQNVQAATIPNAPLFFWYVSAAIYKLFTLNGAYVFETWVLWVKILPALYGALTCVAMYFLGKELFKGSHENAAGLFAGIFAAVVPSFVYRTMGGFFEDDSFGFLWMVMGFVFFVRAVRSPSLSRENLQNAILAGVCFALMAFAWSAFNMLVPILLGIGFVQFFVWLQEGNLREARDYGVLWLISFGLLSIGATLQTGIFWLDQFGGILGNLFLKSQAIGALHVLVFILAFIAILYAIFHFRQRNTISQDLIRKVYTVMVVLLVLAPLLVLVFNVSLRTGDVLGQTVGEESEGRNYFGNKYSAMVVFALIGIPAMGYLLLRKSRHFEGMALPLVWIIVTFFMAWGKLKFTYYWGLPLALTGMVVFMLTLEWMKNRSVTTQKIVALGMGSMVLISMGVGIMFVTNNVPNIESTPGWKEALFWSEKNLPADTRFFNWWDEGHWISFLTGKKVLLDNRNTDTSATSNVAQFFLAKDQNTPAEIVQKYGSTHLIFGNDLLEKLTNMGFYAYGVTNGNDPRIQGIAGFVNRCSKETSPLTKETVYVCGGNRLSPAEMNALPATWTNNPNNLQNGIPFMIYRSIDNRWMYAFTQPANQTGLVRLWMGETSMREHFTEIYRNDGDVRIFQVA